MVSIFDRPRRGAGSVLASRARMTAALSALLLLAAFLAAWTGLSVLWAPVLVLCIRSRARANARMTHRLERQAWAAARRM
jgi:hypothetical protein